MKVAQTAVHAARVSCSISVGTKTSLNIASTSSSLATSPSMCRNRYRMLSRIAAPSAALGEIHAVEIVTGHPNSLAGQAAADPAGPGPASEAEAAVA